MFRIFKSVDEYQAIKELVFRGEEGFNTLLQIAYRICYYFYWIVDNLSVAAKIKIFRADWKPIHRWSLIIRCLALLISLFSTFYQLRYH